MEWEAIRRMRTIRTWVRICHLAAYSFLSSRTKWTVFRTGTHTSTANTGYLKSSSPRQNAVRTQAAPPHKENNEREPYVRKFRRDCTKAWSQVWTPLSFLPSCISHPSGFSEAPPLCGKQNKQNPKTTVLPTAFEFSLAFQKMIWEEKDKNKSWNICICSKEINVIILHAPIPRVGWHWYPLGPRVWVDV